MTSLSPCPTALAAAALTLACANGSHPFAVSVSSQEASSPTLPAKDARTPAQRKIDSQLLQEIVRARTEGEQYVAGHGVKVDRQHRALVDVRTAVTPSIEKALTKLGSTIVSTSVEYRSVVAWIPLAKIEAFAADPDVIAIMSSTPPELR